MIFPALASFMILFFISTFTHLKMKCLGVIFGSTYPVWCSVRVPGPAIWCLALTGEIVSDVSPASLSSPAGIPYYAWSSHL